MKVGSLFSGIGGIDLGLQWAGMEIVWQVEIDEYCRRVLAKHWPTIPKYGDIHECGKNNLEPVDIICGGFPCQPFSSIGKQRGTADDRYLWPEMLRIISELRPTWVIAENVIGIDGLALDRIISDLEASGYEVAPPLEISAASCGLQTMEWHTWIIAAAIGERCKRGNAESDSHNRKKGIFQRDGTRRNLRRNISETRFCRVAERVSRRLDKNQRKRLIGLGNAVPPIMAEMLGMALMNLMNEVN